MSDPTFDKRPNCMPLLEDTVSMRRGRKSACAAYREFFQRQPRKPQKKEDGEQKKKPIFWNRSLVCLVCRTRNTSVQRLCFCPTLGSHAARRSPQNCKARQRLEKTFRRMI